MITVQKYAILPGVTRLQLPSGFEILSARSFDDDGVYIWAKVDTGKPLVDAVIHAVPTGEQLPYQTTLQFIDTIIMSEFPKRSPSGMLVFHIFSEVSNGN